MPNSYDPHDNDQRYEWNNQKFQNSEQVAPPNKELIQQFCDKCFAEGLSKARVKKYITNWHTIFKMIDWEFLLDNADKEEIERVVAKINQTDYADSTKCDLKCAVKKYYKTMEGEGRRYPEKVKFVNTTRDPSKKEHPDPLSREEIDRIIDACKNPRDRAMYFLLYEGGLRSGELMSLQKSDIEFLDKGVRVNVQGKTGNRHILVVESERYLREWFSYHPFPDQEKVPLWTEIEHLGNVSPEEARVSYDYMRINLKRKAREAEVRTYRDGWKTDRNGEVKTDEKGDRIPQYRTDLYPYLFRHSRATHLATELTESAMKSYFGWTQGSDMPQVYIHLSGRDIDNEILNLYGIKEETDKHTQKQCSRCFKEYRGPSDNCPRCGAPFQI